MAAAFLSHLRVDGRAVPVNAAEVLLLIASGVDNIPDLQRAMPTAQNLPLPEPTARRLVALLRGRARYEGGAWIESPFSLVSARSHPHKRGQQLLLTPQGEALISTFFGDGLTTDLTSSPGNFKVSSATTHLGANQDTCEE